MGEIFRCGRWVQATLALIFLLPTTPGLAIAEDRPTFESPAWVGTGSCAATACHGGRREPVGLKGSEYSFSQAYDPHVRAYSVLFDDRSKRIEKNLKRLADLESAAPHENNTCLRCHVYQGYDSGATGSRSAEFALADGVSCEGCHGAAGRWLVPHTEAGFRGLSDRQKFDFFGMRPTKDLLARGQACAECHVGLGSMDVNHDLIAAGHPRLNFEYGNQLAKLPKHWRVDEDKARHPDYDAKVWILGQVLTAKASLDLLETRATRSIPEDSKVPWPEFAEYSCFSCHHELVKDGWAAANVSLAAKPGTLQWGTWTMPMSRSMPSGVSGLDVEDSISPLGSIRTLMALPNPDAATVAQMARSASSELGRLADSLNRGLISPPEVRSMLTNTLKLDSPTTPLDWDRAARQYLAIIALDKAAGAFDSRYSDVAVRESLGRLLKDLNLPLSVERRGVTFDSPYRFDPRRIKDDLQSVQAALSNP